MDRTAAIAFAAAQERRRRRLILAPILADVASSEPAAGTGWQGGPHAALARPTEPTQQEGPRPVKSAALGLQPRPGSALAAAVKARDVWSWRRVRRARASMPARSAAPAEQLSLSTPFPTEHTGLNSSSSLPDWQALLSGQAESGRNPGTTACPAISPPLPLPPDPMADAVLSESTKGLESKLQELGDARAMLQALACQGMAARAGSEQPTSFLHPPSRPSHELPWQQQHQHQQHRPRRQGGPQLGKLEVAPLAMIMAGTIAPAVQSACTTLYGDQRQWDDVRQLHRRQGALPERSDGNCAANGRSVRQEIARDLTSRVDLTRRLKSLVAAREQRQQQAPADACIQACKDAYHEVRYACPTAPLLASIVAKRLQPLVTAYQTRRSGPGQGAAAASLATGAAATTGIRPVVWPHPAPLKAGVLGGLQADRPEAQACGRATGAATGLGLEQKVQQGCALGPAAGVLSALPESWGRLLEQPGSQTVLAAAVAGAVALCPLAASQASAPPRRSGGGNPDGAGGRAAAGPHWDPHKYDDERELDELEPLTCAALYIVLTLLAGARDLPTSVLAGELYDILYYIEPDPVVAADEAAAADGAAASAPLRPGLPSARPPSPSLVAPAVPAAARFSIAFFQAVAEQYAADPLVIWTMAAARRAMERGATTAELESRMNDVVAAKALDGVMVRSAAEGEEADEEGEEKEGRKPAAAGSTLPSELCLSGDEAVSAAGSDDEDSNAAGRAENGGAGDAGSCPLARAAALARRQRRRQEQNRRVSQHPPLHQPPQQLHQRHPAAPAPCTSPDVDAAGAGTGSGSDSAPAGCDVRALCAQTESQLAVYENKMLRAQPFKAAKAHPEAAAAQLGVEAAMVGFRKRLAKLEAMLPATHLSAGGTRGAAAATTAAAAAAPAAPASVVSAANGGGVKAGGAGGGGGGAGGGSRQQLGGPLADPGQAVALLYGAWRCAAGAAAACAQPPGVPHTIVSVGARGLVPTIWALRMGEACRRQMRRGRGTVSDTPSGWAKWAAMQRAGGGGGGGEGAAEAEAAVRCAALQPAASGRVAQQALGLQANGGEEQPVFPPPPGVPGVLLLTIRGAVVPEAVAQMEDTRYDWRRVKRKPLVVKRREGFAAAAAGLRASLVTEHLGAVLVSALGAEGLETALLAVAQLRVELLRSGRDLLVCVTNVMPPGVEEAYKARGPSDDGDDGDDQDAVSAVVHANGGGGGADGPRRRGVLRFLAARYLTCVEAFRLGFLTLDGRLALGRDGAAAAAAPSAAEVAAEVDSSSEEFRRALPGGAFWPSDRGHVLDLLRCEVGLDEDPEETDGEAAPRHDEEDWRKRQERQSVRRALDVERLRRAPGDMQDVLHESAVMRGGVEATLLVLECEPFKPDRLVPPPPAAAAAAAAGKAAAAEGSLESVRSGRGGGRGGKRR